MIASEIINPMIPPLRPGDSVEKALRWMDEFRVDALPVVEGRTYKGLITEEAILDENNPKAKVGELRLEHENVYASESKHIYDVLKTADDQGLRLLAVLSNNKEFLGVVTVNDTFLAFSKMSSLKSPGSIVVLSMEDRDYSLAEISRITESNDTKILSVYVAADPLDVSKIKVTLKFNRTDIQAAVASMERFGYKIIAQFDETELSTREQERLDSLMRYLDF